MCARACYEKVPFGITTLQCKSNYIVLTLSCVTEQYANENRTNTFEEDLQMKLCLESVNRKTVGVLNLVSQALNPRPAS